MVRIVFFGTPLFSLPALKRLIDSSYSVVGVVTQPDRPKNRGYWTTQSPVKEMAHSRNIPVLQPDTLKNHEFLNSLTDFRADLGVVVAYGKILPETVLKAPRLGLINVHASLLPKYRGAAPIQRAIMAGEDRTGITIIKLVRRMDAGPILARQTRCIDRDETSDDVERDLADIGARLLLKSVDDLISNRIKETVQDECQVTYAPALTKVDGLIDWSQPGEAVHNRVRALHSWPRAYTFLRKLRYVILKTCILKSPDLTRLEVIDYKLSPGQVLEAHGDRLVVSAGPIGDSSAVSILTIQPEGRRPLTTREFLAGHKILTSDTFRSSPEQ